MNKVVISMDGTELGYLISNIFVPKGYIKYFNADYYEKVRGSQSGRGIRIGKTFYPNFLKVLSLKNATSFIEKLNKDNDKFIFIPCSKKDFNKEDYSRYWRTIASKDLFYYIIKDTYGTDIAYMACDNNIYKSNKIKICMFEVLDKGKGSGSAIVSYLKSLNKILTGLSLVSSKRFWEKQGASFSQELVFKIERGSSM